MSRLRTWYGRAFFSFPPPERGEGKRLLNLGCGKKPLEGFVNADYFVAPNLNAWRKRPQWMLDLRYPLNCDNDYWDGIFTEHVLEHVTFRDAKNLLKEIRRTLKKGGVLRIIVPDLQQIVIAYLEHKKTGKIPDAISSIVSNRNSNSAADIVDNLVYDWGHQSIWDSERLISVLKEVGFSQVQEVSFRVGRDARLLQDQKSREPGSLYVEAIR